MRFVNDEARSYIARQPERFDILQISLIDTWAATGAGAFVLSEHSLYTTEAWELFLDRLTPRGVLSVSRWYYETRPDEMYRVVSLAVAALAQRGVTRPGEHLMIVRHATVADGRVAPLGVATLLVSPSPFSAADVDAAEDVARRLRFEVILSPRGASTATFGALARGQDLPALYARHPVNIEPPTDDSPFFFHTPGARLLRPRVLAVGRGRGAAGVGAGGAPGDRRGTDRALHRGAAGAHERSRAAGGGGPARGVLRGHRARLHARRDLADAAAHHLPRASDLRALGRALRHARLQRRGQPHRRPARRHGGGAARGAGRPLVVFGVATPYAIRHFEAATTPARIAVAVALLFPLGFLMGMAFPLGMRLGAARTAALGAWLWGINGATSVCASVLAVAIALHQGIAAGFWTGVACYVVATVALTVEAGRQRAGR